MLTLQLETKTAAERKQKPDFKNLGFGQYFTDHMFVMDYSTEKGWHDAKIVPYAPLQLDPAAMVFHYGQAIFEGLKAYKTEDGNVLLFRPEKNMERMNRSCVRLSMPQIDGEFVIESLKSLLKVEKDWIPTEPGTSLYIRPFMIATEACFGVRPSHTYKFMILLSPVGAYYAGGMKPVKIHVESKYVRAVRGGTGVAKTSGNYAGSLIAQAEAKEKGYEQVLWLDGVEQAYIEEVGAMNVFFKVKGEVWTPELNGSILDGVTRNSVIRLLQDWGIPVVEKRISVKELFEAYENGDLEEAFGTGTAAVISSIGELRWEEKCIVLAENKVGELTQKLYETLTGMQYGVIEDKFGWVVPVE
ncbi:MAG: branched-chain amino acid aminotransferase [Clostridia bacterium]